MALSMALSMALLVSAGLGSIRLAFSMALLVSAMALLVSAMALLVSAMALFCHLFRHFGSPLARRTIFPINK